MQDAAAAAADAVTEHEAAPIQPQTDSDERAETVEPPVEALPGALQPATAAALFRHRAFIRLWVARLAGTTANQMLLVSIGWQMYDLTHSAWDLGLVGLLQFLPALLLVLVAGHVVDRFDRARIVAVCLAAQAAIALALLAGAAAHFANRDLLFASRSRSARCARSRCRPSRR